MPTICLQNFDIQTWYNQFSCKIKRMAKIGLQVVTNIHMKNWSCFGDDPRVFNVFRRFQQHTTFNYITSNNMVLTPSKNIRSFFTPSSYKKMILYFGTEGVPNRALSNYAHKYCSKPKSLILHSVLFSRAACRNFNNPCVMHQWPH